MKFILHLTPAIPASPEERERLRPIAHRTDRTQQMLAEMVELTRMAEDLGFEAVTYSEHHFYTEGLESGATPTPHLINLLLHTRRIKVGPLGFVLPTWDPIRLAEDVAWADQMSRGRVICGFARGIFPRWVNVLGQGYAVTAGNQGPEAEERNREVFEELFQVVKLAWRDEPFSFRGKHYQVPYPAEGHFWPPHESTQRYGAPGEVDETGWLRRVSPVPKPYQKPHPRLFQALSTSERTIRWAARESVVPVIFLPFPDASLRGTEQYQEEAVRAGRSLRLGESTGVARLIYFGANYNEALADARRGSIFVFSRFHAKLQPHIPVAVEPLIEAGVVLVGTVDDIRAKIAAIQERVNPEYLVWMSDQGFASLDDMRRRLEIFGTRVMPDFTSDAI